MNEMSCQTRKMAWWRYGEEKLKTPPSRISPYFSREPSFCLSVPAPWKGSGRVSRSCIHSFMLIREPAVQQKQEVHLIFYWCEQIIDDTSALSTVSIKGKNHSLILNRTASRKKTKAIPRCILWINTEDRSQWECLRILADKRVPARVQRLRNMCTMQAQLS